MSELVEMENCGMTQLHNLHDDPEETIRVAMGGEDCDSCNRPLGGEVPDKAIIVFSDIERGGRAVSRGAKLARFIRAKHLGRVSDSGAAVKNPNTGNNIKAWFWVVDHGALADFLSVDEDA